MQRRAGLMLSLQHHSEPHVDRVTLQDHHRRHLSPSPLFRCSLCPPFSRSYPYPLTLHHFHHRVRHYNLHH